MGRILSMVFANGASGSTLNPSYGNSCTTQNGCITIYYNGLVYVANKAQKTCTKSKLGYYPSTPNYNYVKKTSPLNPLYNFGGLSPGHG